MPKFNFKIKLSEDYSNILYIFSLSQNEVKNVIEKKKLKEEYERFKKAKKCSKYSNLFRDFLLRKTITSGIKHEINNLYNNGFGYKIIGQNIGLTYSNTRKLLIDICEIKKREGRSITTERTKEIRKAKANYELKTKTGWFKENIRNNLKIQNKTHRGVQGFYFNKSLKKFVWLRSTYEYIFAKWLDKTNQIWDIEVKHFKLKNGETYRPDFFIYEKNKISKIIEIKGYYDKRAYKINLLNEQLKDIKCSILNFTNTSIQSFICSDSNYHIELAKWKTERIENKLKKLNQNENKKNHDRTK